MDKMMHQVDKWCRQARALFWEEHKPPPRPPISMLKGQECPRERTKWLHHPKTYFFNFQH